ncbi:MAG: polyribonucleotide nucleotidyltransferase [Rickettsiaceae bacterium H1]|nr:polyribonucleotide nucleotidyltransferase [Rickettsiaceae bacterium H1]
MSKIITKDMKWDGAPLYLETGIIAKQASASVLVRYNDTTVLATVTMGKDNKIIGESKINIRTALTVNFVYKAYAKCKIPGGFVKREGKPTEREILASRIIDRAIRPLFPGEFKDEVHVVCTLLTYDDLVIPEVPSLIAVSAALNISEIPFLNTVVAANVGYDSENYQLNNNIKEENSMLDLIVAGTKDSISMVEAQANELTEGIMLNGIMFGHDNIKPVINFIDEFSNEARVKGKISIKPVTNEKIAELVKNKCKSKIEKVYDDASSKEVRHNLLETIANDVIASCKEEDHLYIEDELHRLEKDIVRNNIIESNRRMDGRKNDDIRNIDIVTDILPQIHGSALFTRGGTQALVTITLGSHDDEQIVDGLEGSSRENFILHYNFPPYSVGESTSLRAPGRREIGHGRLASRALQAVLSDKNKFPYTVRVVSEITESDGSSSMATVCGSSLGLMVAGVPIKSHVAGIAMGLVKRDEKYVILSDILGDEDHLGDMDFKVAGTTTGITALQMDIKISGIDKDIMHKALEQACEGRMHILDKMNNAISKPNDSLKDNAPQIATLRIDPEDITKVIGTGGRIIKNICETSAAKIDIEPNGKVLISASNSESMKIAKDMLENILAVPKIRTVYDAHITGIAEFGVFAKFLSNMEGLIHISEIQDDRVESIENLMKIGDKVKVVVLSVDRDNKVRLSMKYVDQESGEIFSEDYSKALKSQPKIIAGNKKRRNERSGNNRSERNNHQKGNQRFKFF